jgi:hypothetical protein
MRSARRPLAVLLVGLLLAVAAAAAAAAEDNAAAAAPAAAEPGGGGGGGGGNDKSGGAAGTGPATAQPRRRRRAHRRFRGPRRGGRGRRARRRAVLPGAAALVAAAAPVGAAPNATASGRRRGALPPARFFIDEGFFEDGETEVLRAHIAASGGRLVISGESTAAFLSVKGYYVPDKWDVYITIRQVRGAPRRGRGPPGVLASPAVCSCRQGSGCGCKRKVHGPSECPVAPALQNSDLV